MKLFSRLLAFLSLLTILLLPSYSVLAAEVLSPACEKAPQSVACQGNQQSQSPTNNSIYGPNGIIIKASNILTLVVGIAAVVIIIIAGLQYILSSGDANKIRQSRDTIIYAIVGIVVALSARIIISFFIGRLN